ncbi:MAG: fatty acid desaturase family protein, partial [Candidatus Binataceae bacterium]
MKPLAFTGADDFLKTVRLRVNHHFAGRSRRDDPRLHRKAAIIAVWFVASYALLLTVRDTAAQVLLCISYALAAAAVGFNIFHDANHGSFSASPRLNLFLARLTCTALGTGRYFWCFKHNVLHHRFTNVFEWDDDLETRGSLRLSPQQPWQSKFKNQHRWFYFAYSLATIEWLFVKDFVQLITLRINPYQSIPKLSAREQAEFWACKAIYFAVFVALPFAILPAGRVIAGMILFHVVLSLAITLIFNLAHATAKADFPVPSGSPLCIGDEWAAHQMRTTVNFGPTNRVLTWFAGGLNFQIEHHLFPHISHTYYRDISAIVRDTALEFGLPYNVHDT